MRSPNGRYNGSNQLIGEVETPKSDYPALYATMKARGWIGQFNHPASSGQFLVNGTALGYDANGRDVMVLAEVLNTSAFSTNTTQTETGAAPTPVPSTSCSSAATTWHPRATRTTTARTGAVVHQPHRRAVAERYDAHDDRVPRCVEGAPRVRGRRQDRRS
jgi:hypothetical protein